MKFVHLCRTLKTSYSSSIYFRRLSSLFYCTSPRFVTGKRDVNLYRRISPFGDRDVSIEPVLDQWIEEGNTVTLPDLRKIIEMLRRYRRPKHALQVSRWMSDKRYFRISCVDIAVRLNLISKAEGIDQAVIYFSNIPEQMKGLEAYGSLLICYVEEKDVEKAENVLQKMRDLGLPIRTLTYNSMLKLYCKTGYPEKFKSLVHEMEEKVVKCDKYTYGIMLAFSANYNNESIDLVVQKMESDSKCKLDWGSYSAAATAYIKIGCVDKAAMMLKKCEELILTSRRKDFNYDYLITQYTAIGNKADVLRIWELYKKQGKIYNSGYKSIIASLLKFDDITSAELVFKEWESSQLAYDVRIANYFIGYYCRKGLLEKAEALVDRAKEMDAKPDHYSWSWYYMAMGYMGCGQSQKAVDALRRAISECRQGCLLPSKDLIVNCLEYLKGNNEVKQADELIRSLAAKGVIPVDFEKKLLAYIVANSVSNKFTENDFAIQGEVLETPNMMYENSNPV